MAGVPDPAERAELAAAAIAHDFNNLLAVILGCAEELEGGLGDGVQRERAREIVEATRSGTELTRRLMSVGRDAPAPARPIDLSRTVADSRPILTRMLGSRIALECDLDHRLPPVLLPPGRIEQVLVSLVDNCRDAIGPGEGTVRIVTGLVEAAGADGLPAGVAHARLAVSDDGAGMAPEVAVRAGEPYFTTKGGAGNGLGLAGARSLARGVGGDLRVRSARGLGTTVEIVLPVVASAGGSTDPAAGVRADGRGR